MHPTRIVIIGGVAAGASCAARARRLSEAAQITVIERGPDVSFANCGLPYFIGGEIKQRDALAVQTPQSLKAMLALEVRTSTEAVAVDRPAKRVQVRNLAAGGTTDSVMANSKEGLAKLLGFLTSILANSFSFLMDMIFMLFILFFVYLDGERALVWLHRMLPMESGLQEKLSRVVRDVLSGFIFGTLLTCLVQGILAGAAYLLFDVPSPLLLAVLTAIGGLIPVVGTAIIWLPAALYLYLQGSAVKAVILILWGFFAVGMSDNVVKPIFMSSRVTLPILPIMIGAFGGLAAFGVLGAIFGPLLLAILYELYVLEPVPVVGASCASEQGE